MNYDVVTLGTSTQDYFLKLSENLKEMKLKEKDFIMLPLGSKVEIEKIFLQTGGGATNTAVSFSRLGLKTGIVYKVGNDEGGKSILSVLKKNKVDTKLMLVDKKLSTAIGIVLTYPTGERTVLVYRGASSNIHPSEVHFSNIKTRWLYIGALSGASISLFERALNAKAKIALNPGVQEIQELKYKPSLLKNVDVLIMNKEEASMLVHGTSKEMARKLHKHGAKIVVITDGRNGGLVYVGNIFYTYTILKSKPVNMLGAGDAFGSSFVAGLIKGMSIQESLQLASVNTTNVVRHVGAKVGLLHWNQIRKQERKYGHIKVVKAHD